MFNGLSAVWRKLTPASSHRLTNRTEKSGWQTIFAWLPSRRQRLGPTVENVEVLAIDKDPASLLARHLAHDAEIDQVFERLSDGGKRELELLGCRLDRHQWSALHEVVDTECGGCTAPERLDHTAILVEERHDLAGSIDGLRRRVSHARQEVFHPGFPRAVLTDLLQQPIVVC